MEGPIVMEWKGWESIACPDVKHNHYVTPRQRILLPMGWLKISAFPSTRLVLLYFVWVRLTALSRNLRCIYLFSSGFLHWYWGNHGSDRDHSVYAPSQWETALQSNAISHRQGTYTEWSVQSYDCPGASEATMKKVGKIDETPAKQKKV